MFDGDRFLSSGLTGQDSNLRELDDCLRVPPTKGFHCKGDERDVDISTGLKGTVHLAAVGGMQGCVVVICRSVHQALLKWRDDRVFALVPGRDEHVGWSGFGSRDKAADFLAWGQADGGCSLKNGVPKTIVATCSFPIMATSYSMIPKDVIFLCAILNGAG